MMTRFSYVLMLVSLSISGTSAFAQQQSNIVDPINRSSVEENDKGRIEIKETVSCYFSFEGSENLQTVKLYKKNLISFKNGKKNEAYDFAVLSSYPSKDAYVWHAVTSEMQKVYSAGSQGLPRNEEGLEKIKLEATNKAKAHWNKLMSELNIPKNKRDSDTPYFFSPISDFERDNKSFRSEDIQVGYITTSPNNDLMAEVALYFWISRQRVIGGVSALETVHFDHIPMAKRASVIAEFSKGSKKAIPLVTLLINQKDYSQSSLKIAYMKTAFNMSCIEHTSRK